MRSIPSFASFSDTRVSIALAAFGGGAGLGIARGFGRGFGLRDPSEALLSVLVVLAVLPSLSDSLRLFSLWLFSNTAGGSPELGVLSFTEWLLW